jgi:hypothetical protein
LHGPGPALRLDGSPAEQAAGALGEGMEAVEWDCLHPAGVWRNKTRALSSYSTLLGAAKLLTANFSRSATQEGKKPTANRRSANGDSDRLSVDRQLRSHWRGFLGHLGERALKTESAQNTLTRQWPYLVRFGIQVSDLFRISALGFRIYLIGSACRSLTQSMSFLSGWLSHLKTPAWRSVYVTFVQSPLRSLPVQRLTWEWPSRNAKPHAPLW